LYKGGEKTTMLKIEYREENGVYTVTLAKNSKESKEIGVFDTDSECFYAIKSMKETLRFIGKKFVVVDYT